ncbi:MAG: hypothetical protein DELT_01851 [Desulfovibrio sp.]
MKLQSKILIPVTLLIMCAVGASSYFSYQKTAAALENALVGNLVGQANSLAAATRNLMADIKRNAARSAERPDVIAFFANPEDKEHLDATNAALKKICDSYPDILRVSILDATGRTAASSQPSTIGTNFANRNYFQNAMQGENFLAPPFLSSITGRGVVVASAPINAQGKTKGVLICTVSLDRYYDDFVKPIKVGTEGFGYILNGKALVVAHKNPDLAFKPDLPDAALHKELVAQKKGDMEYEDSQGKHIRLHFLTDDVSGSTLVIQAEREDVFAPLLDIRKTSLVIGVIAMVVGALVAFFLARAIAVPVRRSMAYARQVASGDLNGSLLVNSRDEIGQLAEALRSIPASLGRIITAYGVLEHKTEGGQFLAEADSSGLSGEFATLVGGTNMILSRFRLLLDMIPAPLFVLDMHRKVLYANDAGVKVAGRAAFGESITDLIRRQDAGTDACVLSQALHGKTVAPAETAAVIGGVEKDIVYSCVPLKDRTGAQTSVLFSVTDITDIRKAQRIAEEVANDASGIAVSVASASEQLSAQISQVMTGAKTQSERVESMALAMTQMNEAVMDVARHTSEANEQAAETRKKAENGAVIVEDVIKAISDVYATARALENNMQQLGGQVEAIGGVMSVISDIADQTNLLALNAAIEAARAGEAGRGFAVVADEVRKLAEKTMEATTEVAQTIKGVQDAATANIRQVTVAEEGVAKATDLAKQSGEALREIVSISGNNSELVAGIAAATEEQSSTSEEIRHSVEEIRVVTEETAAGTTQSAEAIKTLADQARALNALLERLRN